MKIEDLDLFIRIADSESITEAAAQLEITSATASAALKRLEAQLDAQLFVRSTRQLRITSEGERFLQYSRSALDTIEKGISAINSFKGEIGGTVRISISSDLGRNIVTPWLDEIMHLHPNLALNIHIQDSLSDFYMDRVDVALRYGEPQDSTMVAFKIAEVDTIVCASPNYLKNFGSPKQPNDLLEHNCLFYQLDGKLHDSWKFQKEKNKFKVKVSGNRACNDGELVKRWAVAGKGIALKSRLDISQELKTNRLIQVLADYRTPSISLWLICPSKKQVTPAVLLLRELFRDKCIQLLEDKT